MAQWAEQTGQENGKQQQQKSTKCSSSRRMIVIVVVKLQPHFPKLWSLTPLHLRSKTKNWVLLCSENYKDPEEVEEEQEEEEKKE